MDLASIQNHPFMQTANCGRSRTREEKWKYAVHEAREASANHTECKTEGRSQVLAVILANSCGMFPKGQACHDAVPPKLAQTYYGHPARDMQSSARQSTIMEYNSIVYAILECIST